MTKYQRHQSVISRNSDNSFEEDYWLKRFYKSLQKEAVQPKHVDQSLFEQMNAIMNGKSKHTSVEAAVEDMKRRSGLIDYLEKIKLSEQNSDAGVKVANEKEQNNELIPNVVKKSPFIKSTIENYIRDTKGNLSVPAIIDKVRSIHHNDVSDSKDWEDDKLIIYISNLNLKAKKDNPDIFQSYQNLGTHDSDSASDMDPANTDAFHALNPAKF